VVKRVLLTGMSGTGKSTVISELAARGYKAVDVDADEWSEWVEVEFTGDPTSPESPVEPGRDWVWREDRIQDLLSTEDADVLFISGCAENMTYRRTCRSMLDTCVEPVLRVGHVPRGNTDPGLRIRSERSLTRPVFSPRICGSGD
jgi:hypothetical protein